MFQAFQSQPAGLKVGGKELTILQSLGNGAFGVVYKVTDVQSNVYTLKDIFCLNNSAIISAKHEIEIMKQTSL